MVLSKVSQSVAHGPALLAHLLHRTADIGGRELDAVVAGDRLHFLAAPPLVAHGLELRMDELKAEIHTPERNAGLQHAVHQLLDERRWCRHETALVHQPFGNWRQAIARCEPG